MDCSDSDLLRDVVGARHEAPASQIPPSQISSNLDLSCRGSEDLELLSQISSSLDLSCRGSDDLELLSPSTFITMDLSFASCMDFQVEIIYSKKKKSAVFIVTYLRYCVQTGGENYHN
jgi:hypothetical protein